MGEGGKTRLIAWDRELRDVHTRLRAAAPEELERHLDGLAAIMESHFRYEERKLLPVLETLALEHAPDAVLGPL